MSHPTLELSNYAKELTLNDIPKTVIQQTKNVILDTIGVLLFSSQRKTGKRITQFVKQLGGRTESSVIGGGFKTSCVNAALANGTIAHDIELDDSHHVASSHVAAVVVPAGLAMAERENANGGIFLTGITLAYDIEVRVSYALSPRLQFERNFHPSCVCGSFGAAAAAGKVLQLGVEEFASAMGLAGCQASGLTAWTTETKHMTKSFQTGIAARNGVTSALLSSKGFAGPPRIFEGKYSIFPAFSGKGNPKELTNDLGDKFEIMRTSIKKYPFCRNLHAPFDALLRIMYENNLSASDIDIVIVKLPQTLAPLVDNNTLTTHNAQYVLAVAAIDKKVTIEDNPGDRLRDPEILDLSKRIIVQGDPILETMYPEHYPGAVTVRTKDKREFTIRIDYAKGDPENPLSREEIHHKFLQLSEPCVGLESANRIAKIVQNLQDLDDISQLTDLLVNTEFKQENCM